MAQSERKSMIVTFKRKDQRSERKKDKTEILQASLERPVTMIRAAAMLTGAVPRAAAPETVAFDIDEYEAPIVTAHLTAKEIAALEKDPNIETVEEDGKCYALDRPSAMLIEGQPTVQAETVPWGIARIKANLAWDITRGKGVRVAVLDTGIDFNHPDLKDNYRGGVSFVTGESTPEDFNRHGTHCAGTIAAAINGAGVVGVAPAAYLYAVKVLAADGSGNWSWLISGLSWCISNGIHVASMSLGGDAAPNALKNMCDLAFARGVLLVAAAGNNHPKPVNAPARYGSVVAVSAIDSANAIAGFSCRGPEVELSAPGVNVLSSVPGGGYGTLSGTSMACPHVAGTAALAWSTHRFPPAGMAANVAVRRLLALSADNLGIPGRDKEFGFGRVDAEQAAFEFVVPGLVAGLP